MTINRLHATCAQIKSIYRINLQRSYVNDRGSDFRLCRHFRARPSLVSDQECTISLIIFYYRPSPTIYHVPCNT